MRLRLSMIIVSLAVLYTLLNKHPMLAVKNKLLITIFQHKTTFFYVRHSLIFLHVALLDSVPAVYCDYCENCLSEFC